MLVPMLIRRMLVLVLTTTVTFTGAVAGTAQAEEAGPPQGRQLLYYNHSYGVVDRATADAIEDSSYVRRFANLEIRTTTGPDGQTSTGRYLLGRETYVELFGVGDLPGQDGVFGAGGLGVSVEKAADLETVIERLAEQGITDPYLLDQTRDFGDGVPVPWFDAVFAKTVYDAFGAWGMEYRPEYFADPRSDTEPADHPRDVGRERYLTDEYRAHLMRDVTGVHMAVTALDLANTLPLLRAGGFELRPATGGITATRGGTTLRFEMVPLAKIGLRSIDFSLNYPVSYCHEEKLGRSTLVVGPGTTARWTFPTTPQ